jgi:hypothetical protein
MNTKQNSYLRLVLLGAAVLLEGVAVVSVVLTIAFLPAATVYPRVISVAIIILPSLIGLLSRRMEVAILLAVLPFWVLAIVYSVIYIPLWTLDLIQVGVLVNRVAGASFLVGALGYIGWLLRRVLLGTTTSSLKAK